MSASSAKVQNALVIFIYFYLTQLISRDIFQITRPRETFFLKTLHENSWVKQHHTVLGLFIYLKEKEKDRLC